MMEGMRAGPDGEIAQRGSSMGRRQPSNPGSVSSVPSVLRWWMMTMALSHDERMRGTRQFPFRTNCVLPSDTGVILPPSFPGSVFYRPRSASRKRSRSLAASFFGPGGSFFSGTSLISRPDGSRPVDSTRSSC